MKMKTRKQNNLSIYPRILLLSFFKEDHGIYFEVSITVLLSLLLNSLFILFFCKVIGYF